MLLDFLWELHYDARIHKHQANILVSERLWSSKLTCSMELVSCVWMCT
jgi:hypothetical protein